jgi:DNA-binding transcriptional ArsR family regulator
MKPRNEIPRTVVCLHEHGPLIPNSTPSPRALDRAARLFRALGDAPRLQLLHALLTGEVCVGGLVTTLGQKFSTVSQRLRILRSEGLVVRRRDGSHVYYTLADDHVKSLVSNALAHADELDGPFPNPDSEDDE